MDVRTDEANGAVTIDRATVEYGCRIFDAVTDLAATIEEHREALPESVTRSLDSLIATVDAREELRPA